MWRLEWLVEQETFNRPGLDSLEDAELSALLQRMERARECAHDGMAYEEADLVRNLAADIPDDWIA